MKLGFFTACLPEWTLEQVADYAVRTGFDALEIAAWPRDEDRPFTATHLNATDFSQHNERKVDRFFKGERYVF